MTAGMAPSLLIFLLASTAGTVHAAGGQPQCTGKSASLAPADCAAWVQFYDAAGGGSGWRACSGARTDPCSCAASIASASTAARAPANQQAQASVNVTCAGQGRVGASAVISAVFLDGVGLRGDVAAVFLPLTQLGGLRKLSLRSNRLRGTLPEDAMLNTDVNYLDLSNNQLAGAIPGRLGHLTDLSYLNISHNQLAGDVDALAGLTDLLALDLSDNLLSGVVPHALTCGLTIIRHLDLTRNAFSGQVFTCLVPCTAVQRRASGAVAAAAVHVRVCVCARARACVCVCVCAWCVCVCVA